MTGVNEFQRAFEAMPEVLLLTDAAARVITVSEGYLRATGWTRECVAGKPLTSVPPYLGAKVACRELADALETLRRSGLPIPNLLPDAAPCPGGISFARGSSLPVTDAEGRVTHITHRLEACVDSAPAESDRERRLRKIIEHNADPIVWGDARANLMFASPAIVRVTGYTPEEFLARPTNVDIHPEDVALFGEKVRHVLAHPGEVVAVCARRRHRDGSYRHIELTLANLLHDPDVRALVANVHDVTERVKLEEELVGRNEQLKMALSAAGALSWDVDFRSGRVAFSSDFGVFFGAPPGDYGLEDIMTMVHAEDRERVLRIMRSSTEPTVEFEFRGPDRGAETRWYAMRGRTFRDADGNRVRQVGVTLDITDMRRIQEDRLRFEQHLQERQRLESLGVLAGGIAHDFNNLLTAVLGHANLLETRFVSEPGASFHIRQIEEASRRASDLCRQLLAYAGKGPFSLAGTNLNALIEETAELLQVSISKRAVLRFALQPDLPPTLADATQMRQVLMNLLINASDALAERGGVITVCTKVPAPNSLPSELRAQGADASGFVCVEVSDTGRGMAPDTQARIFEPFFSTKGKGRGLGLSAVLGIVRRHGGVLKVHSELGRGTVFTLFLPTAPEQTAPVTETLRPLRPLANRGMVLVVDDEDSVRNVACSLVQALGLRTVHGCDGREAVALYREHRGQIIAVLMDMSMPHMDGLEAYEQLTRIDPRVRVLLMSGYTEQDAQSRFAGHGLAGFIQKPFSLRELEDRLHTLLG